MTIPRSMSLSLSIGLLLTVTSSVRAQEQAPPEGTPAPENASVNETSTGGTGDAAEEAPSPESASGNEPTAGGTGNAALMCAAVVPDLLDQLSAVRTALHEGFSDAGSPLLGSNELLRRRDAALPPDAAPENAGDLRDRARAHFLAFEFDEARGALERARQSLLDRYGDLLWDPDLARIELDLARVLLDLGHLEAAAAALRRAALVAPRMQPEPGNYPPRLLQAWNEVMSPSEPPAEPVARTERERLLQAARALEIDWVLSMSIEGGSPPASLSLELLLLTAEDGTVAAEATVELPESRDGWQTALEAAIAPIVAAMVATATEVPEEVNEEPTTRLYVLSTPSGASLDLNGEPTNATTPWVLDVSPGPQRLGVSLAGYRSEELVVAAWPGQTRPVEVYLERGGQRQWYRTWWFWTLVGVVVTGGVAGFVSWGVLSGQDQPDVNVVLDASE